MGWTWIGGGRTVDPPVEEWLLETSRWLINWLGGRRWLADRPLVLPTERFFARADDQGAARARRLFASVKALTDMQEVDCVLLEHEGTPSSDLGGLAYQVFTKGAPAGTFVREGNQPVITYAAHLASDPKSLIATFAHELAHLRLATVGTPPPGGWDHLELATDLCAVLMGFGVFLANSAFTFTRRTDFDRQGWSTRRQGYLSENALTFALAVFLALRGDDGAEAHQYLKPHLAQQLDKAMRRIRSKGLLEGWEAGAPALD
jgi:hypothetical protein